MSNKKHEEDYLLSAITAFIAENGRFPYKDEMTKLEKDAEAKRIAELPSDSVDVKKEITLDDIALEILELAEEIMEYRRENNPDDIRRPPEPYPEALWVETDEFQGNILNHLDYPWSDFHYSCAIGIKEKEHNNFVYYKILIQYCSDGTPVIRATDFCGEEVDIDITQYLITIHKGFVEMAKQVEFDFESEIDYQKFSS